VTGPVPGPHAHSHHPHDFDWDAMAEFAELDAEVLMPVLDEATSALLDVAGRDGLDVRRILDVGCGAGVATCRLAERFGKATVVAADGSSKMLASVAARAERLGVGSRVETRLVDLPAGLDELGSADLVWISMALHHVGDEAAALRALRAHVEPGGVLALVEFGDPLRVVPAGAELGDPEVWQRLDAVGSIWIGEMRASLPGAVESGPYPEMLAASGFEVLVDRKVAMQLDAPLDHRARQLAHTYLTRMREHVEPYADAADLAVLDRLVDEQDPAGILRRPDALLHVSRHLFVARATGKTA
jgi:SAM-dependent methyltransferase